MSRSPSRSRKPYVWAIGVLWVAPAVFVVAAHLLLPDHNASGQCEGIGFGCATTPADTVLLLGVLASPFLLLSGVIAMAAIALRQATRPHPAVDQDL